MKSTSCWKKMAMAVVTSAVICVSQPSWAYGAVAIVEEFRGNGKHIAMGYSYDHPTALSAQKSALKACNDRAATNGHVYKCSVRKVVKDTCVSVWHNGTYYFIKTAATSTEAKRRINALPLVQSNSGQRTTFCDG